MKIVVFILTMAILGAVLYLGFAFVSAEWHVFNWHWISRAIFALLFMSFLFAVLNNLNNGKTK